MIYFAIVMVIFGIICFLYVLLPGKRSGSSNTASSSYRFGTENIKPTLFNIRYPETRASMDMEERIRMERRVMKSKAAKATESEPSTKNSTESVVLEEPNFNSEFYQSDIEEILLESEQNPETSTIPEDSLIQIEGLLFLDYARKIPFKNKKIKEFEWKEEHFSSFKRVGIVNFNVYKNRFVYVLEQDKYEYQLEQITQVIFYENAFALIPENSTFPIPLFFTKETEILKKYLSKIS